MMNAINSLIAMLAASQLSATPTASCYRDCRVSPDCLTLVSNFEGYSPFRYKDVAGLDTIGHGHLIRPGEKIKEPLMPEDARKLLLADAAQAVAGVNRRVTVKLRQHQADAIISWTFNLGEGSLASSTMLKRINAARHDQVPGEIKKWDKARVGGKLQPVRGLTIRREAEAMVYGVH